MLLLCCVVLLVLLVLSCVPFKHKLNSSLEMFCFNYANALPICTDTYSFSFSASSLLLLLLFSFLFFLGTVAPVCRAGQRTTYSSGRQETVKVACEIDANPAEATYVWKFNATQGEVADIPASLVAVDRGRSVAHYTPQTENVSIHSVRVQLVHTQWDHINHSMLLLHPVRKNGTGAVHNFPNELRF